MNIHLTDSYNVGKAGQPSIGLFNQTKWETFRPAKCQETGQMNVLAEAAKGTYLCLR